MNTEIQSNNPNIDPLEFQVILLGQIMMLTESLIALWQISITHTNSPFQKAQCLANLSSLKAALTDLEGATTEGSEGWNDEPA